MRSKVSVAVALPLLAAGCLVLVVQGPGDGLPDSGVEPVNLPDGGVGYRLPDGGITTSLVEPVCSAEPRSGVRGAQIYFDGTQSQGSPGAEVDGWAWSFGDGATGTGEAPSHIYADAGTYTATLTATDDTGASGSTTCPTVTIGP